MSIGTGSDSGSGKDRYAALATLLREQRRALGLSRKDVCELTGLSYPYVSQLEGGYRAPSLATARKLADALHLDVEQIVVVADDTAQSLPAAPRAYANPRYARSATIEALAAGPFQPETMTGALPAADAGLRTSSARRTGTDAAVADAAARLIGLPAGRRLDALAEVQRQVVDSVVEAERGARPPGRGRPVR